MLACGAPYAARAFYSTVQIVAGDFAGVPVGPLLIYTPFDGAQGLLVRGHVMIQGVLEFQAMIATGDPGTLMPYSFWIEQQLRPMSQGRAFGWAGTDAKVQFDGTAQTYEPIPVTRAVTYTFSVDRYANASGMVPVEASGVDIPPGLVSTRLDHFVKTSCSDFLSFQSAIEMNFVPLSSEFLIAAVPYSYTGAWIITYTYISADQLQNQVANGDFEGSALSPWSSSGAGAGRLASPAQCLDATNQLLELEAGSPVEVSQPIATPPDPFTLGYDYGFAQDAGTLEIWLGDTRVDQIQAAGLASLFRTRVLSVSDPAVLGQGAIPLRIVWNAASGERAWIDNVQAYAVPEPTTELLAAASLLSLCGLCRRRPTVNGRTRTGEEAKSATISRRTDEEPGQLPAAD